MYWPPTIEHGDVLPVTHDKTASKVLRARLRALLARLGVGGDDGEDSMEERFAAALYIEVHDFEAALSFCAPGDTELQEAIRVAQATSEFEKGEYVRSAILYARTRLPIEQVASKFHQAQLFLPLKHYLYAQLFFLCAQCAARRRLPSSALVCSPEARAAACAQGRHGRPR